VSGEFRRTGRDPRQGRGQGINSDLATLFHTIAILAVLALRKRPGLADWFDGLTPRRK